VERYNEGKAIDAVLQQIEAREKSCRRDDGRSPDDLRDPDPLRRVDYVCTVGDRLYAFEHTGIEPFSDQIEMTVHNQILFGPVGERFDKRRSDAEFWELYVPVEASVGLRGRAKVNRVTNALIRWIETNAASFTVTRYGDKLANPFFWERRSRAFPFLFLCTDRHSMTSPIIFQVVGVRFVADFPSSTSLPAIWKARG